MVAIMTYDLTDFFRTAVEHTPSWSPDHVNAAVHMVLDRMAEITDEWDAASGEDWVQFMIDGDVVIYLRVNFPLAFVIGGYETLLDDVGAVVVPVDNFQTTKFRVEFNLLRRIVTHCSPTGGPLSPSGFTVQELWRASI